MREEKIRKTPDFRFYIVHPSVTAVYYIGFFTFLFLFSSPVFIITAAAFAVAAALYYNGFSASAGTFKFTLVFGLIIFIINPLVSHRGTSILFYLFGNPVTAEALAQGGFNFIAAATSFILFLSFNRLMDSEKFLYAFSFLSPKAALVTSMTIRFAWLYSARVRELADVRRVNAGGGKTGILSKVREASRLLSALTSWSLEEGMQTALALRSKGYGARKRSCYALYKFTAADGVCLFIMLAILAALTAFRAAEAGGYEYYPTLGAIRMTAADTAAYALMTIYLAIPFAMEGYTLARRKSIYDSGILS